MTTQARIERLSARLEHITAELDKRDFSDVPTAKLVELEMKTRAELAREFPEPHIRSEQQLRDAKADGTAEILRSFSGSRIRITRNKENMGAYESSNRGFKIARGKYVARLDADDIAMPTRVERQAQHLDERLETGLVVSGVHVINESGKPVYFSECKLSSEEFYYLTFPQLHFFIRQQCSERARFWNLADTTKVF